MLKSFYKKRRPIKVFFDKEMKYRSLAYGSEVNRSFVKWREYFDSNWNAKFKNFFINAQGDVGGNPVRSDDTFMSLRALEEATNVKRIKTDSVLPPLWLNEMLLEVSADGFVTVSGRQTHVNIGLELKAWALMPLVTENGGTKTFLFVAAKPPGMNEMHISAYGFNSDGPENNALVSRKIDTTVNSRSYLVCYERHVFLVHNSMLDYFYFVPDTGELDRVAIGGDKDNAEVDCCKFVGRRVIADNSGNVYWIADNSVYGFPIGYPRRLAKIETDIHYVPVGINCYENELYVYRKNKSTGVYSCTRFVRAANGNLVGSHFNDGAASNLMLENRQGTLRYLKLTEKGGIANTTLAVYNGKSETTSDCMTFPSRGNVFCLFGLLDGNAVYAGYDENGNIVCLTE